MKLGKYKVISTKNTELHFGYTESMPKIGDIINIVKIEGNTCICDIIGLPFSGYYWHKDDLKYVGFSPYLFED